MTIKRVMILQIIAVMILLLPTIGVSDTTTNFCGKATSEIVKSIPAFAKTNYSNESEICKDWYRPGPLRDSCLKNGLYKACSEYNSKKHSLKNCENFIAKCDETIKAVTQSKEEPRITQEGRLSKRDRVDGSSLPLPSPVEIPPETPPKQVKEMPVSLDNPPPPALPLPGPAAKEEATTPTTTTLPENPPKDADDLIKQFNKSVGIQEKVAPADYAPYGVKLVPYAKKSESATSPDTISTEEILPPLQESASPEVVVPKDIVEAVAAISKESAKCVYRGEVSVATIDVERELDAKMCSSEERTTLLACEKGEIKICTGTIYCSQDFTIDGTLFKFDTDVDANNLYEVTCSAVNGECPQDPVACAADPIFKDQSQTPPPTQKDEVKGGAVTQ